MPTAAPRTPLPALVPPYPEKLTAYEAACYLRHPSVLAFKKWARRRGIVPEKRGPKITLWPRVALDEVLALEARCRQTTPPSPPSLETRDPRCPK